MRFQLKALEVAASKGEWVFLSVGSFGFDAPVVDCSSSLFAVEVRVFRNLSWGDHFSSQA